MASSMCLLLVQALLVVKYLLEGHSDDRHVIQALCDFLQTTDEEHADVRGLDKCTGELSAPTKARAPGGYLRPCCSSR